MDQWIKWYFHLLLSFLLLRTLNMIVCGILYTLLHSLLVMLGFNSKRLLSCNFFPPETWKVDILWEWNFTWTLGGLEPSYNNWPSRDRMTLRPGVPDQNQRDNHPLQRNVLRTMGMISIAGKEKGRWGEGKVPTLCLLPCAREEMPNPR